MIKRYLIEVSSEGKKITLDTWANGINFAIDNMVLLETVDDIFVIKEIDSGKIWNFNGNFAELRSLRKKISFDIEQELNGHKNTIN